MTAEEQLADVPPMPVTLAAQALRGLMPLKFGRGVRLDLLHAPGAAQLTLSDSGRGSVKNVAATPAGWIEVWETAAEWARPAGFRRALEVYAQRCDSRRTALRSAEFSVRLDAQMRLLLGGLTFLGGHGAGDLLQAGMFVDLRLRPSAIVLVDVGDGGVRYEIADADLTGAEAGGPGKITSGGFVATAGHGLVGDLVDREAASWMTEKFGRTEVRTTVRITGIACELFFCTANDLPEHAQIVLAEVRAMARGNGAGAASERPGPEHVPLSQPAAPAPGRRPQARDADDNADLVTKLERLTRLRESGALTELEFRTAKDRLLG